MSKKEQVEKANQNSQAEVANDSKGSSSSTSIAGVLGMVLGLLGLGLAGYVLTLIQSTNQLLYQMDKESLSQQTTATQAQGQFENHLQAITAKLNQQQRANQQIQQQIEEAKIHSAKPMDDAWLLSEAGHFVRTAQLKLSYEHNVGAAISLLTAVKDRFAKTGHQYVGVRQALEKDLLSLQSLETIDKLAKLSELEGLTEQVSTLKVGMPSVNEVQANSEEVNDKASSFWRQALDNSMHELKKLVVVRKHDDPISLLLSPKEHAFLNQLIVLALQKAQWALLMDNEVVFHSQLKWANRWVSAYYQDDKNKEVFLAKVEELSVLKFVSDWPTLEGSLSAITQAGIKHSYLRQSREQVSTIDMPQMPDSRLPNEDIILSKGVGV